ncbi:MAG: molybdopterin cofactor-binding domain-containing protein [Thermodesulfobacteriota bacterium]
MSEPECPDPGLQPEHKVIGVSVPRIEALEKVTGQARFAADLMPPGMLHGRILRSRYPHARILNLDTSRARRLAGVKAVVTWRDAPDVKIGLYTNDWRFFAKDKVHYLGDVVAAVAAVDVETAREALELIQVEYEELPALYDPLAAMEPGAILIHDDAPGNVAARNRIRKGDAEKVFVTARHVFEDTYRTQMVDHCPLETHAAVAQVDFSGKTTVWSSTQAPFNNRVTLARGLRIPMNKLRVVATHVGGAFGGKQDLMVEPSCVLLARASGRPVRIVVDREEEFMASTVRHPFILTYKTAVDSGGRILARRIRLILDFGAYNELGEGVLRYAALMAAGPYRIEHVWLDGLGVYTNRQVGGVMRGVGVPQVCFAGESQLDAIAEELGVDPLEIRRLNAFRDGDLSHNGQVLVGIGFRETLERIKSASGFRWKSGRKNHGFGIASKMYTCGAGGRHDYSSAVVRFNEDGTAVVQSGAPDVGQGARTVLAQIAAQELGLQYEDVWVDQPDTDVSPVDLFGANASRITYVAGNAVKAAAAEARKIILKAAAEKFEAYEGDLNLVQGQVFVRGRSAPLGGLKDLVSEMHRPGGRTIVTSGAYHTTGVPMDPEHGQSHAVDLYLFGAHVAEVEVDPETGKVTVLNVWAAHDVGKAINPLNVEGQIEGGVHMGLGFALTEEIVHERGRTLNPSFHDYKILTCADMPVIHPLLVEVPEPLGPYGARGVGESTNIPTAAAVANAVYQATGVRFKELPLTPERVLAGLKQKARLEGGDGER